MQLICIKSYTTLLQRVALPATFFMPMTEKFKGSKIILEKMNYL